MPQFISAISLIVPDYDQGLEFYIGLMGFELIEDTPLDEDKRWVLVAPPGSTETRLLLARATNEAQEEVIGEQAGDRVFLFLETYDFDGDFAIMLRIAPVIAAPAKVGSIWVPMSPRLIPDRMLRIAISIISS